MINDTLGELNKESVKNSQQHLGNEANVALHNFGCWK